MLFETPILSVNAPQDELFKPTEFINQFGLNSWANLEWEHSMTRRDIVFLLLPSIVSALSNSSASAQADNCESHIHWVANVLTRMSTLKVGSTRNEVLKLFTPEGGVSQGQRETFASRDCPYFKIDVEYMSGWPSRGYDDDSPIVKMTKPYLGFSTED